MTRSNRELVPPASDPSQPSPSHRPARNPAGTGQRERTPTGQRDLVIASLLARPDGAGQRDAG